MAQYKPATKQELQYLVQDETIYLGNINTSLITDMSGLFEFSKREDFRGIETWDVSNVTNMVGIFYGTAQFNQNINSWDVSNVTDMAWMFCGAKSFNQDISGWDVSNVINMEAMFRGAVNFDQNISIWNVSGVKNMTKMLSDSRLKNHPPSWYHE